MNRFLCLLPSAFCLLLSLAGCASPIPHRDATAALIARPDFAKAADAAPAWVGAALQQITAYEAELSRK